MNQKSKSSFKGILKLGKKIKELRIWYSVKN